MRPDRPDAGGEDAAGEGGGWPARGWLLAAAIGVFAGAQWLRTPHVAYVAAALAATVVATIAAFWLPRGRRWALVAAAVGLAGGVLAARTQVILGRIDSAWPAYRAEAVARGSADLQRALSVTADALRSSARRALATRGGGESVGGDVPGSDRFLDPVDEARGGRGIVVYSSGRPVAWMGRSYVGTDSLHSALGIVSSPFYVTMYAVAARDSLRAVATAVVHADPPADQIAAGVADRVAVAAGLHGFAFPGHGDAASGAPVTTFAPGGAGAHVLLRARPVLPGREEARLAVLERARWLGSALVLATVLLLVIGGWRAVRSPSERLAPLGIGLGAVALLPLSALSTHAVWFDPTVYFAEAGGPFTATLGGLMSVAALVLLAVLLALRSRQRPLGRRVAAAVVLVSGIGGPLLLRALARGVSPPPGGATLRLWLGWETALFLATAAILLIVAAAGGAMNGERRGLTPIVAPVLALAAAGLGPFVLRAPGWWPAWYEVLWIAAIASLALSRRHRWVVLTAASVAALAATTLTWVAGVRGRVALANRDVASLGVAQPDIRAVLSRMGDAASCAAPVRSAAGLMRLYMQSDLVGTGYPVALASWTRGGSVQAHMALAPMQPPAGLGALVRDARQNGGWTVRTLAGMPGVDLALAVPYPGGAVITVVVGPRTRLIEDDPYAAVLGLRAPARTQAPYTLALVRADSGPPLASADTRWARIGTVLRGERDIQTTAGTRRALLEVELRSPAILIQRGTLVVLLDLLVMLALWVVSVLPGGGVVRWSRVRLARWAASYRARLTIALFGFFVVPAAAFAVWSYSRLQTEDRQSRELLLRDALRTAVEAPAALSAAARRDGRAVPPRFEYRGALLERASDPLLDALMPAGTLLPASVARVMHDGRATFAARVEPIGSARVLFGYQAVAGPAGEEWVLAEPARGNADVLDRRRRDLAVFVLFATVLGALGALWLSRVASRSLALPIGRLRAAALAIAGGSDLELGRLAQPLAQAPPDEFAPVFDAFRRMAADLGDSRAALESAQRRTAAVLRTVASGVIALGEDGTVTLANPRAETLLGIELPAGVPIARTHGGLTSHAETFLRGVSEEETLEFESGGRRLQARFTRLSGTRGGEGGSGGGVITLDDITELARVQRVLAWGEMARQVAHEIKNPLTPIRLGVQHLQRTFAGASREEFGPVLHHNAERILAEIDRLDQIARSFSRYGAAPTERPVPGVVDAAAVVRDTVELERLGQSDVRWTITGDEAPLPVVALAEELREVMLNVLENARLAEATAVRVRCAPGEGSVVLEVVDDGRGIGPDVLPRIFEPHFSTRTSGSGLGLAMSRQLVESWGGSITITSDRGGTTVRLVLRAGAEA